MSSHFTSLLRSLVPGLLVGLGLASLAGCHVANTSDTASFASVTISNHPPTEIQAVTAQVFHEAGYAGGSTSPINMTFEKAASGATAVSLDGIAAAQSGQRTVERVRVELVDLDRTGAWRLQCQAYVVTAAGDSFHEDETRLTNLRSGPYRSLLDKVAKRLK